MFHCFSNDVILMSHDKRPVKLIKRVKIAHSFLQSVSDQFRIIILSLPKIIQLISYKILEKSPSFKEFAQKLLELWQKT